MNPWCINHIPRVSWSVHAKHKSQGRRLMSATGQRQSLINHTSPNKTFGDITWRLMVYLLVGNDITVSF